uniref:Carboxyl-terminal processing protease n=1 Tax=Candidatus Kentrum sp. LPFa TaxID=2126335 RepID=A0A450VRL2_9GAMM|nr:MAG: carboxyl-terminal processing protease [Candidatus Kentron sp. LPFa]VFK24232.1 MAG: carboxyl-terminal processing protease [Candidatus Kentron sp. LPFa]
MRRILLQIVLVSICFSLFPIKAFPQQENRQAQLAPLPRHAEITKLVVGLVANYHYRKVTLDDALSKEILKQYLQRLDPNRSFFEGKHVRRIESLYGNRLDDALRDAKITPAFDIFKVYEERVAERMKKSVHLVSRDFDFGVDENYIPDRAEQPWPSSTFELDEAWRKRVKNDFLVLRLEGKKDDAAIRETLRKRYETSLGHVRRFTSDDICQAFINAYAAAIGPHTTYLSPRNMENLFIHLSQSLEGIGAVLQSENEYTVVRKIIRGGPADKDGKLQVDDVITGVGQGLRGEMIDVVGWRLQDVVNLIRGRKDSVVRLQILEGKAGLDGPAKQINLVRNRIDLADRTAKKSVIEVPAESGVLRVGVIDVPAFYSQVRPSGRHGEERSTTRDVRRIIDELRKETVDGIVLDLRGNSGGSLDESITMTGLFLESGPVVQVRKSDGKIAVRNDTEPGMAWSGPLVVLVDQGSASASEIFAGAIQDYGRGLVIGGTTHGKGTVQHLIDLDKKTRNDAGGMGRLKLTIAQFFRINGASTQYRGIVPDIMLPGAEMNFDDNGERALENALPWSSVSPVKFSRNTSLDDILPIVRARHEDRIMRESVFGILREELAAQKKDRDRIRFTLLETQRGAKRKAREDAREARENQLRIAMDQGKKLKFNERHDREEEEKSIAFEVIRWEAANVAADLINAYRD